MAVAEQKFRVISEDPARIMRRLVRHWAHKYETELDDTSGRVHLGEQGSVVMQWVESALAIQIQADDQAGCDTLREIVVAHLQSFEGERPLRVE